GLLAGGAREWRRGHLHPERSLVLVSGAWHAVGPALVLSLARAPPAPLGHGSGPASVSSCAGAPPRHFGDVPLYAAALAAQFGFDFASAALRERIALGFPASVLRSRALSVTAVRDL